VEPKDWRLVRLNKTGGLLDYEQILLDGLFQDATTGSGDHQRGCPNLGPASPGGSGWHKTRSIRMSRRGWFTARPTGSAEGGCSSAPRCSSPERRWLSWQPLSATSR